MDDINTLAYHRAIRIDTDEWVYGYLLKRKDKTYIATQDNMDYMVVQDNIARLKLFEVIPNTICAYSQVNDIDDIKIYNGDILETVAQEDTPFCKNTILFVNWVYTDGYTRKRIQEITIWFILKFDCLHNHSPK